MKKSKASKKFYNLLRDSSWLRVLVVQTGMQLCLTTILSGQVRQKISINSGWEFILHPSTIVDISPEPPHAKFSTDKISTVTKVNIPHTWNAKDILDEEVGYLRSIGWYRKPLFVAERYAGKNISLFFEGVCIQAKIYVNGQLAGEHNGGFTAFNVNVTNLIKAGQTNDLIIRVDNSKHLTDSIPPLSGDFNLMGGIYRDAWMVITNPVRFQGLLASPGVRFCTPKIDSTRAEFEIDAYILGITGQSKGKISYTILKEGNVKAAGSVNYTARASHRETIRGSLIKPELWSPESPSLYDLNVQLFDENNSLLDEVQTSVGFRWFGISAQKEFMLNGKPYKLKGASRHQDFANIGSALSDEHHWNDIKLMKSMGCNFIRIAHYPQDPAVYEACDKLGLISWSEIPVVDKVVNSEAFHQHSEKMMYEMVWQNFNHPSVAIWGYHNEVRNLDSATLKNAARLEDIVDRTDPYRLTAMAFESNFDNGYFQNPLLKDIMSIADIIGYNVYEGWYRGTIATVPEFINKLYSIYPSKPMMLSEYGAGSSTDIHTNDPTIFDFSEEYQTLFQEPYLAEGNKHPWMIGWGIWNFIDFQRDGREDVQPNINNKGMVTSDRKPKDVYYYYKANWSNEPFVYIAGKNWTEKILFHNTATAKDTIIVYSNQPSVQLSHNGSPVKLVFKSLGKFAFGITAGEGRNHFTCSAGGLSDNHIANYVIIKESSFAKKFPTKSISFNTGQTRTFYTDKSRNQWLPDKPYKSGSWGYVGGSVYNSWPGNSSWDKIREGVHKPVMLTEDEPVFQTFVEGLTAWKAAVPDGAYRISLYLCEPLTDAQRGNVDRIFSIRLGEEIWMDNLHLEKEYGLLTAVILHKEVYVRDGKGLQVDFIPQSGKTILNGISIRKL